MNELARRQETWSPFRQLNRLRDEIDRFFESPMSAMGAQSEFFSGWAPAVDFSEDKDRFIVKAELPGMKKEGINVTVEGDTLCICGQRSEEKEEGKGTERHRSERFYGRFQRNLTLPQPVDVNKIEARYKDVSFR